MQTLTMAQDVIQFPILHNGRRYLPEWLSVGEAADRSGYHPEYLRRIIREGRVKAIKKGLMWWVDPVSLDAYLKDAQGANDARYSPRRKQL